jgi:hypothetical protein
MPRPELTQEQASLLTSQEYEHLKATYSALFQSVFLNENSTIELTTLEGAKFSLQVTSEGWRVLEGGTSSERERTWEMVEDLLRSVSPLFKQGWDTLLFEKLHALANSQNSPPLDPESPIETSSHTS